MHSRSELHHLGGCESAAKLCIAQRVERMRERPGFSRREGTRRPVSHFDVRDLATAAHERIQR
jgi:hypothetical protein